MFVIDSSYEVSQEDYKREKDFIKSLVRSLNMSSDSSRAALISYGDHGSLNSRFIGLQSLVDFDRSVDNASYIGGDRRIDNALEMVTRLLSEAGTASSKVVIFLTGGKHASSGESLGDAMEQLRHHDAKMYVIAIGKQADFQELRSLVGSKEDVLKVLSFKELNSQKTRIASHITEKAGERENVVLLKVVVEIIITGSAIPPFAAVSRLACTFQPSLMITFYLSSKINMLDDLSCNVESIRDLHRVIICL